MRHKKKKSEVGVLDVGSMEKLENEVLGGPESFFKLTSTTTVCLDPTAPVPLLFFKVKHYYYTLEDRKKVAVYDESKEIAYFYPVETETTS